MGAETATIWVAGIGAWSTIIVGLLKVKHQTNGPIAKLDGKLDHLIDRVNNVDVRLARVEGKLED